MCINNEAIATTITYGPNKNAARDDLESNREELGLAERADQTGLSGSQPSDSRETERGPRCSQTGVLEDQTAESGTSAETWTSGGRETAKRQWAKR